MSQRYEVPIDLSVHLEMVKLPRGQMDSLAVGGGGGSLERYRQLTRLGLSFVSGCVGRETIH